MTDRTEAFVYSQLKIGARLKLPDEIVTVIRFVDGTDGRVIVTESNKDGHERFFGALNAKDDKGRQLFDEIAPHD